jgi:hypothetical protein
VHCLPLIDKIVADRIIIMAPKSVCIIADIAVIC